MNHTDEKLRSDALAIWKAGLAAVDAQMLTRNAIRYVNNRLTIGNTSIDLESVNRIAVLGAGKASGWMAAGLIEALGPELVDECVTGWVNVPEDQLTECGPVKICAARPKGINLPTQAVVDGTAQMMRIANELGVDDVCICLISGGGSALLEQPIDPVSISDIRDFTRLISSEKASINEINTVRKKLSHVKGGGLAIAAHPAQVITLILSDIVGDPIDLIASGPTVKDEQEIDEAIDVVSRFDPYRDRFAQSIWNLLGRWRQARQKLAWPSQLKVSHQILGNNDLAVRAACEEAIQLGYEPRANFADAADMRTANETGIDLAHEIHGLREINRPVCLISGGEPTVELSQSPGLGGRNQQLVLAALVELIDEAHDASGELCEGQARYCLLSGGTDGEDGNVPIAGAVIDQFTVNHVIEKNVRAIAQAALDTNDAFTFLESLKCTFTMHPTKTNVSDLRVGIAATACPA